MMLSISRNNASSAMMVAGTCLGLFVLYDYSRPFLWFARALVRLKGKVRSVYDFDLGARYNYRPSPPFGNLIPPVHTLTQKICASSLKRFLAKSSRRWILSWFFPRKVMTEKTALRGYHLAHEMVRYCIIPFIRDKDLLIVKSDDHAEILGKVRAWISKTSRLEDSIQLPTVPLLVGEDEKLPVSYLPMTTAIRFSSPPIYNPKWVAAVKQSDEALIHGSIIPVFVSHRWASPDQPNCPFDFDRLLGVLLTTIQCSIQSAVFLKRSKFPMSHLLSRWGKVHRDLDIFPGVRNLVAMKLDTQDFQDSQGRIIKLPSLSGVLVMDIFQASAEIVERRWKAYESLTRIDDLEDFLMTCYLDVTDKIWLWYDYTCLPQRLVRHTDAQLEEIFSRSLSALPIIQRTAHTFSLNSSPYYIGRAWCYAEFMTEQSVFGRSEMGKPLQSSTSMDEMKAVFLFQLLINPLFPLQEVLHRMELAFTQDDHSEKCTVAICWCMWNTFLRDGHFLWKFYYLEDNQSAAGACVGLGTKETLIPWLQCIQAALLSPFPPIRRAALVGDTTSDEISRSLPYSMDYWAKRRELAQINDSVLTDKVGCVPVCELNITYAVEQGGLPVALQTAMNEIDKNSTTAEQTGEKICFKVMLKNTTEAKKAPAGHVRASAYDLDYEFCSQDLFS